MLWRTGHDEARKTGRSVIGPDDLCMRRQVTMLGADDDAAAVVETVLRNMRKYLEADPRLDSPDRPAVLDTPTAHAFSIGDDEVIAGTADSVATQIIEQCHAAGHFAATFNRAQPPEALKKWYAEFGRHVIPRMRGIATSTLAAAS